jgi:hypothetical protein
MTPIALELTGPFVERPNRLDVRPIEDLAPVAPHVHEPDVSQHTQVLRNTWLSDGQRLDDVADRTLGRGEKVEDVAAAWLGHGVERVRRCSGPGHDCDSIPILEYVKRLRYAALNIQQEP